MSRRRRVRYSPEFKAEAIRIMRTSKASLAQIARELGVSEPTLRDWWTATRPPTAEALTVDERTELSDLRREVRQLREERDILKKATAFFAKQSE